jgi:choline monooxygenase
MRSPISRAPIPDIHPDVAHAHTLPSSVYVDTEVYAREKEAVFGKTWQIVGRRDQVLSAGDYFTVDLFDNPLLIVRGNDGVVRGFYNVCRHRAGNPATGCGSRKVFRCGYHGWTYDLTGKLLNAPEMQGTKDFRMEDFGLIPVQADEFGAWVFVNLDENAEPLTHALREMPAQTERFRLDQLKFFERRDYIMKCNWKVYVDNYLEGYHLPSVHPGLNQELDYGAYTTETFERHSKQSSPIRGPENESTANRRYKQATGETADYFWIFPNWMLNCYPDNTSVNIVVPLGTQSCLAIFEWYYHPELATEDSVREGVRFSDQIQIEDGAICEIVHKNLKSRVYDRGRYSAKQERGVHHFHHLYSEWMK